MCNYFNFVSGDIKTDSIKQASNYVVTPLIRLRCNKDVISIL